MLKVVALKLCSGFTHDQVPKLINSYFFRWKISNQDIKDVKDTIETISCFYEAYLSTFLNTLAIQKWTKQLALHTHGDRSQVLLVMGRSSIRMALMFPRMLYWVKKWSNLQVISHLLPIQHLPKGFMGASTICAKVPNLLQVLVQIQYLPNQQYVKLSW